MMNIHPEVYKSLHDEIDQLKAENSELRAKLEAFQWKPIETAPTKEEVK